MALDGPKTTLTPEDTALFQKIMLAKGVDQQAMMKALSPTKKRELLQYIQMVKSVKKIHRLEGEIESLDAREAALQEQDKSLLVQSSSSYAKSVGSVQSQTSVHTGPTAKSVTKFGY